jgi:hypothetical protein
MDEISKPAGAFVLGPVRDPWSSGWITGTGSQNAKTPQRFRFDPAAGYPPETASHHCEQPEQSSCAVESELPAFGGAASRWG